MIKFLYFIFFLSTFSMLNAQYCHIDQFGYQSDAVKVAVLSNPQEGFNENETFEPMGNLELIDLSTNQTIYSAPPTAWDDGNTHAQSGDQGWWFDFTEVTEAGSYIIRMDGQDISHPFNIEDDVYSDVLKASARMFFYNRCNDPKPAQYATLGWDDNAAFLNDLQDANCRYVYDQDNPSLEKDLSGGWFDAGDFNKYTTFAHTAVFDLLWAYKENPQAFTDDFNIPESGNGIPDILDEIKIELDWILKMMNEDGSCHIKMGNISYADNALTPPSLNSDPRYYGPTCSSASIAACGMLAFAAEIYSEFPEFSSYAENLEERAITAWNYSLNLLQNNSLEEDCDDGSILSGDADWSVYYQQQMMVVAAAHLFATTGNSDYSDFVDDYYDITEPIADGFWGAYLMTLNDALMYYASLPNADQQVSSLIETSFATAVNNNYNGFFGANPEDLYRSYIPDWSYHWGSNSAVASYGALNMIIDKYGFAGSLADSFREKAQGHLNYFHGVNPLDIVYLSNMYSIGGDYCINEIYHGWFYDQTEWDHALESTYGPPPGYLVGGPNQWFSVEDLNPPYGQPLQKSYLDFNDDWPNNSWELSEPAIYYQASYVRLLAWFTNHNSTINVGNLSNEIDFQVYPNPAQNEIQWKLQDRSETGYLFSSDGRKILEIPSNTNRLDISHLPQGNYFIKYGQRECTFMVFRNQ